MSFATRASSQALVLAALLLAGCAADGSTNFFTTGALGTQETAAVSDAKVDPVCVSLVSRIEALRKEGVADKIEKAATKKYKLTKTDLSKADQLTKANSEFQVRCSTITPSQMSAMMPPPAPPPAPPSAVKAPTKKVAAPKAETVSSDPANPKN